MPSYKAREGVQLEAAALAELIAPVTTKFWWFREHGYEPHYWQTLFHTMRNDDRLCRFRHLVAGRRGGKTMAAAWELAYYLLHPAEFHRDVHNEESDRPLVAWVLTKDYPLGLPALMMFRDVLKAAGVEHGREYKENRGHHWFEFENGSWLFFKTADDPDSLRGAGLDWLWIDESAIIPSDEPWLTVSPALAERLGSVTTTTTPKGKNWFWDEWWRPEVTAELDIGRVEYWSIDNPYFPASEWERYRRQMHPAMFKQEFCAAFDSMAGNALHGDWLHYYGMQADPQNDIIEIPKDPKTNKPVRMNIYMGVDPAISLSDKADKFAMAVVGIVEDNSQAFLLDTYQGRIPFPEQVDQIQLWANKWRPTYIGIESVAYQAALAQQALRLPGLPNIVPMFAPGKKPSRIMGMAPVFRTGRIRIRKDQRDFIDQWIDYDDELSNPKDDLLDAVEIALRCAGVFLPGSAPTDPIQDFLGEMEDNSLEGVRRYELRHLRRKDKRVRDSVMGFDW